MGQRETAALNEISHQLKNLHNLENENTERFLALDHNDLVDIQATHCQNHTRQELRGNEA